MKRILRSWQGSLRAKLIDLGDDPDVRAIRLALLELGTDTISHARGRSLLDHLLGTGQILENWASRRIVCRAGTFHSVYSTDVFPRAAIGIGDRKRISAAIGSEAERLVYLFCAVDRARFLSLVESAVKAGTLSKTIKMSSRFSSKESLVILHTEIVSLLTIYAANLAEQSAAPDGGPTPWLFTFSKIAQLIKQIGGEEIPSFKDGNPFADTHDEVTYINTYQSWLDAGVLPTNQAAFPSCDSLIGEPWLWRALWSACDGHLAESQTYAAQGLQNLTIMGAAWDKRLSHREWLNIAHLLARGRGHVDQARENRDLITSPGILHELLHHRVASPKYLPRALSSRASNLSVNEVEMAGTKVGRYLLDVEREPLAATTGRFPELRRLNVWNPMQFPLVQALEASSEAIRSEVAALDGSLFAAEAEPIKREGAWDVVMLYERGKKHSANCSLCPTITQIIERYETIRTLAGLIYISRMRAHTHIESHRGPTNLRLRCHLGLEIPTGPCGIRVGNDRLNWSPGKCIVFDDFFEHEAWNDTDSDRIVLIVDIWHPDLTEAELSVIKGLHTYTQIQAHTLQAYWAANDQSRLLQRAQYH